MTTAVYARVSTDKQDEESQLTQIKARGWSFDYVIRDKAASGIQWQKRALGDWMTDAKKGDVLIVSELSRIARSVSGVMSFLQEASESGITVKDAKTGTILDDSLPSVILSTVFALAAQIEKDLIKSRTKAAVSKRRAENLPVGRQVGAKNKVLKYQSQWDDAKKLLDADASASWVARMLKMSRQTLYTLADANGYSMTKRGGVE